MNSQDNPERLEETAEQSLQAIDLSTVKAVTSANLNSLETLARFLSNKRKEHFKGLMQVWDKIAGRVKAEYASFDVLQNIEGIGTHELRDPYARIREGTLHASEETMPVPARVFTAYLDVIKVSEEERVEISRILGLSRQDGDHYSPSNEWSKPLNPRE